MIINQTKKYLFIHIPKCAGESISNLLFNNGAIHFLGKHDNVKEAITVLADSYDDYYTFTVVRNPFSQVVSFYEHLRKPSYLSFEELKSQYSEFDGLLHPQEACQLAMSLDFKSYVKAIYVNQKGWCPWFDDQTAFLTNFANEIAVTDVFKAETLSQDIKLLKSKLKLIGSLERINRSHKPKNFCEYYDEETHNIIAEKFKNTIDTFQYKFEDDLIISPVKKVFQKVKHVDFPASIPNNLNENKVTQAKSEKINQVNFTLDSEKINRCQICLVILFNHPYIKNLDILEEIYRPRFPIIKYIMPVVSHSHPDVMTAYRGSYNYHGFICDKFDNFKNAKFTHYIFMQDDVLLHPSLNFENILESLDIYDNYAFIHSLEFLAGKVPGGWSWVPRFLWKILRPKGALNGSGFEGLFSYLPPLKYAVEAFKRNNLPNKASSFFIDRTKSPNPNTSAVLNMIFQDKDTITLPYPFAKAVSDFFIVPSSSIDLFVQYLGIFAAAEVFAEIAIPTALVLSSEKIIRQTDLGLSTKWYWDEAREKFTYDSKEVFDIFCKGNIFIHPVKLSKFLHNSELKAEWMKEVFFNPNIFLSREKDYP